jgi:hypothetical protein
LDDVRRAAAGVVRRGGDVQKRCDGKQERSHFTAVFIRCGPDKKIALHNYVL